MPYILAVTFLLSLHPQLTPWYKRVWTFFFNPRLSIHGGPGPNPEVIDLVLRNHTTENSPRLTLDNATKK